MNAGPYTIRYETLSDGWHRASVAEHPGVFAEADTAPEARRMMLAALMGVLQAHGDLKPAPIPAPSSRRRPQLRRGARRIE